MRPLTDEELGKVFAKLNKYIGENVKQLIERDDGTYTFRLHKDRVYYSSEKVKTLAACVQREQLISFGTCLGKFTKTHKFRLHITALDYMSPYAKYKVWLKAAGEQSFLYGNHVQKSHLARITEGTPNNVGVIIYNLNEMPLVSAAMIRSENLCAAQGFGVTARSAADCRRAEATTLVALHQADVGEYIRAEDTLI